MQRMLAAVCLVAGVFVMFGAGPALLAAGALLWVRDDRAAVWLTEHRKAATERIKTTVSAARELPRRAMAGSAMGVGLAAVPAGMTVVYGAGAALVAAGALLIGFSLLSGWGA